MIGLKMTWVLSLGLLLVVAQAVIPGESSSKKLVEELQRLDPRVVPPESKEAKALRTTVSREIRARRDAVNQRESRNWNAIKTKEDWERYRNPRLEALRRSLGQFPPKRDTMPIRVTGRKHASGFIVENVVYESRPGLWVTANLYVPAEPAASMPGILIFHSHHNPKTQGELQDMGLTWARQGAMVLIMDQLGHGERRQHPFVDAKSFAGAFKPSRQDYYFRYNVALQLHLVGESLMGWMAWDMMRGVDLLLAKSGIDPKRIMLLGAVAGGGDPCAVAAALDQRIAAAVPFNFGGPQPESPLPLPEDAEESFNYAGGGSWESTRNLRLSCRDGFLPWVIVGGIAPRGLVYGHEFAWDQQHDPVWKRLQRIYGFYEAGDRLAFAIGKGKLSGQPPDSSHCNNIGAIHRRGIYAAFKKWFHMPEPAKEYQDRLPAKELQCITAESPVRLKPVHELTWEMARERSALARKRLARLSAEKRKQKLCEDWAQLLGNVAVGEFKTITSKEEKLASGIRVRRILLVQVAEAPGHPIYIPLLILLPRPEKARYPVVVALAQEGKQGFLAQRAETLASLLEKGMAVCLPDLRGTGETRPEGDGRGRASVSTSLSASELMLGRTMLGSRLRDLRTVLSFLRQSKECAGPVALWGDSFAPVNRGDKTIRVPWDASPLPAQSEPLGGLLALFGALFEDDVGAVYCGGGLVGFESILKSPFLYVPHDAVIPGALTTGDLDDVAAVLAPRPVSISGPVDGLNRQVPMQELAGTYTLTGQSYKAAGVPGRFRISAEPATQQQLAAWLIEQSEK